MWSNTISSTWSDRTNIAFISFLTFTTISHNKSSIRIRFYTNNYIVFIN
nr:MAG TPA: hypothetical protein [Caudoviricetes sp.]